MIKKTLTLTLITIAILHIIGCGSDTPNNSTSPTATPTPIWGMEKFSHGWSEPAISDDGRYISYVENGEIYRFDTTTKEKILISIHLPEISTNPSLISYSTTSKISGDGQHVLFLSHAQDLVKNISNYPIENSYSTFPQLYIRDIKKGTTSIVSSDTKGTSGANHLISSFQISKYGQFVSFTTAATNLVDKVNYFTGQNIYIRDLSTQKTELVSISYDETSSGYNKSTSLWAKNDSDIHQISDDGRYITFQSTATNLVENIEYTADITNVFLRDTLTKKTTLLSKSENNTKASQWGCGFSYHPGSRIMSSDASLIVFGCKGVGSTFNKGYNLFLHDQSNKTTTLVLHNDEFINYSVISANGNYIAFNTAATDIISNKEITYSTINQSERSNIYRWEKISNTFELISTSSDKKSAANFYCNPPVISGDGKTISYNSHATNLTTTPEIQITFDQRQSNIFRWNQFENKNTLATQIDNNVIAYSSPITTMSSDGKTIAMDLTYNGSYFIKF